MKELIKFPKIQDINSDFVIDMPIEQKEYLVNGELKEWTGKQQDVYSPIYYYSSNNEFKNYIGSYPLLTEKEATEVLDAAVKAYDNGNGIWPSLSLEEKIMHMHTFISKMKEKRTEVVNLLMWEIGKNYTDSQKEFDRTIKYIIDTIDALKDLDRNSSKFIISGNIISQVKRAPLGVTLCMGPFNYPLNETFTTLIPALLMGNTIVFKPPKLGVLLHQPLLKAFKESFPAGVVNTVYGDGEVVISPMMKSGKINVLAFIGSSRVADILKKQHPQPHRLRSVLGLEAKNPAIVLLDANIEQAVDECITGALSYNGQRCTALKILFVHENILDKYIDLFKKKVGELEIGLPWDNANITPLPEPNKSEYLTELITDAIDKGAKIINNNGGDYYKTAFNPTILYPVKENMRIYCEEQFGPIVPIVSYKDINEPLKYIVNSNYGQQASVFGQDSDTIAKIIDILVNQVCRVNINAQCQRGPDELPFTGRKDSAEGTLSVSDALRVFSIRTLVATKYTDMNKQIISEITRGHKSKFLSTGFVL